jgi:CRISPR-associated protein Csd2
MQITKSTSGKSDSKSDTMGTKSTVDFGLYVAKGSINCSLSEITGFSEKDAEKIKDALISLFENDESSARPAGSMQVVKVIWWKHNCKNGQYSPAKVHDSLEVKLKDGVDKPKSADDYEIKVLPLEGLAVDIYDGK